MTDSLSGFVTRELAAEVPREVASVAARLAGELGGLAVLYYGSTLRTGDFSGILDFYVLTKAPAGTLPRRIGMRWLWPDVSYHEFEFGTGTIRAKVATMPLSTFESAARGRFLDTTIWARFVQPAALVWQADSGVAGRVARAVADAIGTAGRFAAVLGPASGVADDYWRALFRETYRAEMRVEPPGREGTILMHDPARYDRLLPMAWRASGIDFAQNGAVLAPTLGFELYYRTTRAWLLRAGAGKALNIARLVKAAFTFDGAAKYGAWKVQRHTGVAVELTPWRERHPILAGVSVLWRVMHSRAS